MIRLPDLVDDTTLHGLDAAGCCTNCAQHVLAGAGNQVVDERGRVHRHCARCHGELMSLAPKPLSPQLGGTTDPGPTSAGQGPDLPSDSPLGPGLSPGTRSEDGRPARGLSGPGGTSAGKEQA